MLYDYVHPHHSMDIELATSRDGIRFRRVQNGRKVVELGRRGDFDAGMVIVSPMAFLVHDDRIWFYYTATPDTFQEGPRSGANRPWHRYTGLVNWRLDGLTHVQVAPGAQSGSLLTAPFQVRDRGAAELWINAAVGDRASALTAELVDAETRHPLEGYTRAESERFQSDSTGHALRWRRSPTLGGVRVPRIRVRFHLAGRDVRLHAFGFRPAR
jgi:hypothetical protein